MYDLPHPGNDVGMKVPATAQDSAKGNMETGGKNIMFHCEQV